MAPGVFISYSRGASATTARRLTDELQAAGIESFLDVREIPFGAPFPATLADALLDARVIVVFAEAGYFERPWCVHEMRLITAAWRAGDAAGLAGVIVALPAPGGDVGAAVAQLPPPLAAASWPHAGQHETLAMLVADAVRAALPTLRERLSAANDPTAATMRGGADVPLPWAEAATVAAAAAQVRQTAGMPSPRGDGLVGRARELWLLAHECVTARAFTPARHVVVRGLGGSGKSLLAAEFVARYAARFFPAGVVWVDAEAGPAGLDESCAQLWRLLAPSAPVPGAEEAEPGRRRAALALALAECARDCIPVGRLLWVIDDLPETGRDDAGGLDAWCPLLHQATVLATTRRGDTLRGADATLTLGPLPAAAGVELLTRAPVEPRWMLPHEWDDVVRWAGSLPLVLALLREGLIDGSLALAELKAAPRTEPAAAACRLMDALRGEVDDASLRGVSQAFELSLRALEREPALAAAALRLALLAPVALPEALLHAVADAPTVGRLVRRGWMQPVDVDEVGRAFTLHRVPASALRERGGNLDAAFAAAFDGLARLFAAPAEVWRACRFEVHLDVLRRRFFARTQSPSAPALDAAARLAIAAVELDADGRRGARFLAAGLANAVGAGDAFVQALRGATPDEALAAAARLPHVLQALPDSAAALDWMLQLLADPRPVVQWQAIVHAPPVDSLALPTLRAILRQPAPEADAPQARIYEPCPSFQPFLRAGIALTDVIGELMRALVGGPPLARRRAARIAGDLITARGRDFQARGYRGQGLVRSLLKLAMVTPEVEPDIEPPEPELVVDLAEAAARGADPLDDAGWAMICGLVDQADPRTQLRAVQVARHYLRIASDSGQPPDLRVERDDEGGARFSVTLDGPRRLWPAAVVPQLIEWVLHLPPAPALEAARIVTTDHNQGLVETAPWVHVQLDAGAFEAVRRLADALQQVTPPTYINAPWWRAQALVGLGLDAEAVPDFEAVLQVTPDFAPARDEAGLACWRLGRARVGEQDFAGALPWLDRAAQWRPDDFNVHHLRALALYNLQRHDEAAAAAARTIEIDPQIGEAWFFRAIAVAALGRPLDAWPDLVEAARLAPDDERISGFKAQIENWMQANGHPPAG